MIWSRTDGPIEAGQIEAHQIAVHQKERDPQAVTPLGGPQVVASTQAYLTGRRGVGGMGNRPVGLVLVR